MSRAGPRNPPAPRESAEEQSQGCCEGAGSEQPCPRHRSAGQEAGEGAEDPAAGHQPQTRTGNKAEGGEGGTAPGAAAEASPRRGERRTERCSGSSRAPGGSLTAENGRSRAGLFGVASPSTRTHTQAHTHPLSPREPCPRLQGVWEGSDPTSPHTHPHPRRILPSADPAASAQAAARLGGPTAAESRPRRPDPFPAGRATLPPAPHLIPDADGAGRGGGVGNEGNLPRLVSSRPDPRPPPRPLRALTSPHRLVPALLGGERGRRLYRPLKWLRERKGGERGGGASPRSAGSAVQSSRRRLADAPPRRKGRGRARSEAAAG